MQLTGNVYRNAATAGEGNTQNILSQLRKRFLSYIFEKPGLSMVTNALTLIIAFYNRIRYK